MECETDNVTISINFMPSIPVDNWDVEYCKHKIIRRGRKQDKVRGCTD